MALKIVIIESPYAGNVAFNTEYARLCLIDSLNRGEAPFASHLLYTQVLDDKDYDQRLMGINAGLKFHQVANLVAFYADHGFSPGMNAAWEETQKVGVAREIRHLFHPSPRL